ncbi:hypothetical protein EDB19DRAFT_1827762 [Suillus lakei]|nr:hypothetical protein EDB19DRAFT_1827762 [Suillus lakei]
MPNQWKPTSPLDVIQPHILRLWKAHQMDREIVTELQKYFNTVHYGLSLMKFLKIREGMGLQRVHQQNHNVESIHGAMTDLHPMCPNAGASEVLTNMTSGLALIYLLDMPMVTQSDPGSENYGIANAHTMLHTSGLWCHFQLWELDAYQDCVNNTRKWQDRNKILPHGTPNIIYQSPENFSVLDFKIKVECEALDHVRDLYIDPSHIVFNLVPWPFSEFMEHCYTELRCPVVTRQTVWDVYLRLLTIVQASKEMIPHHIELYDEPEEDLIALPLLENYQDLPDHEDSNGGYYMGGTRPSEYITVVDSDLVTNIYAVGEHLHQLESLARDDKPNITLGINENAVGLDHAGLVVWEFSDGDDLDDNDLDVPDKW